MHLVVKLGSGALQQGLVVQGASGKALEPHPAYPDGQLLRLLAGLLELHGPGHWLLDKSKDAYDRRPFAAQAAHAREAPAMRPASLAPRARAHPAGPARPTGRTLGARDLSLALGA